MKTQINLKRAYEPASPSDGYRIYVDRLWPRGLSHENFHYDLWDKEISPSTTLRQWFHADPGARWDDFEKQYSTELNVNPAFNKLMTIVKDKPTVTLLFSSHDSQHNNAVVVKEMLATKKITH